LALNKYSRMGMIQFSGLINCQFALPPKNWTVE
jgi:hypothetical protein